MIGPAWVEPAARSSNRVAAVSTTPSPIQSAGPMSASTVIPGVQATGSPRSTPPLQLPPVHTRGKIGPVAVHAVVREWRDDEGWGVVDSPETPGGCWAHFSHIAIADGYRATHAGQQVMLEWQAADQDGLDYRAVRLWPVGQAPVAAEVAEDSTAYTSALSVTFGDPTPGSATLRVRGAR